MAASSVLFSAMSLLVPLTRGVSAFVVTAARFATGIAVILAAALAGLTRLSAVNRGWLVVRGLVGATAVYLYYRGIMQLGLGKGTVLNNTYPVFAALLAPLLLRERIPLDVLAAVVASFGGIWLVVSPGRIASVGVEELLALLGGVLGGAAIVAIKKLRETDSSSVIYLAQCLFGLLVVGWPTARSSFAFLEPFRSVFAIQTSLAPWLTMTRRRYDSRASGHVKPLGSDERLQRDPAQRQA